MGLNSQSLSSVLKSSLCPVPSWSKSTCHGSKKFRGHQGSVWDVQMTHCGPVLALTASEDRTVRVWNLATATSVARYVGHQGSVLCSSCHPTRELVVTGSTDNTAHVWSMEGVPTGPSDDLDNFVTEMPEAATVLIGHYRAIVATAWMAVKPWIVTSSRDRTSIVFDVQVEGTTVMQLGGHDEPLTHNHAHSSEPLLLTSSEDATFRLWDFRDPFLARLVFRGHQGPVISSVFANRDSVVISAGVDRTLRTWDCRMHTSPLVTSKLDSVPHRIAVSSHDTIAVALRDCHVDLYNLHGSLISKIPRRPAVVKKKRELYSVAWVDDSTCDINLLASGSSGYVRGWNVTLPMK